MGVQGEGSGSQMGMERQGLGKNMESLGFPRGLRGLGRAMGCREGMPSLRVVGRILGRGPGSGVGARGVRGRAWNWVIGKESWEGHRVQGRNSESKGRASGLRKRHRVRDRRTQNQGKDTGLGEGLGSQGAPQNP